MLSVALLSLAGLVAAQNTGDPIVYDTQHNVTSLYGTWATGSGGVQTGSGFANPSEMTFTYPKTTGWSVSFSSDYYFEWAQYTFVSNGSDPSCITGYVFWTHGQFTENENGSLTMSSFGDGYQQVQDACGAESNVLENTNQSIYVPWWNIAQDTTDGYLLKLQKYDQTYYPPFKQISTTPNMLPTRQLREVTLGSDVTVAQSKRDLVEEETLEKRNAAPAGAAPAVVGGLAYAGAAAVAALGMLTI